MKFTKNHLGTKPLIWLLFLAISSFWGIFSCSKTTYEPEKYEIKVHNNYFENVSVSIDRYFLENLPKETISNTFFLTKGTYLVTCISQSRLKMESSITLQGNQERIIIEITPKGVIIIQKAK
ncbi:hypothetical protein ACI76O_10380 [Capnocytophaga cynodegmi]|uniref:hypothetical protein n=1 Tax=Capnocytophaga cynodegmi TaxID=28189 RepID=UPI00385D671D